MMLKQLTHICLRAIWKPLTGACLRRRFIIKYVPLTLHRVRLQICPAAKNLKIWRAEVASGSGSKAGEVTEVLKNGFKVTCGSGVLLVTEVQPESKKRMPAAVFCNGRGINKGDILG